MKEKKVHFSTLQTQNNYFTTHALFIKPGQFFTFSTNKPNAVSTWANMPSNATKSIWPADIFGVSSTEPFLGWINSPYWAWSILEEKKKELKPFLNSNIFGGETLRSTSLTASMQSLGKSLFMKEGVLLAIVHVIKFYANWSYDNYKRTM